MLIVISPERDVKNETKVVNRLFELGLQRFHLRKPNYNRSDMITYLHGICSDFYSKIVLHGFFDISLKYPIGGLHLSSWNSYSHLDFKNYPDNTSRSVSIHSLEALRRVKHYNYVFLSPVFDSISKTNHYAAFDLDMLKKCLKLTVKRQFKVVALGGICVENIPQVKAMGFDGAAVLGALWQKQNREKTYLKLRAAYEA